MSGHHQARLGLELVQLWILLVLIRANKTRRQSQNPRRVDGSSFGSGEDAHCTCANVGLPLICIRFEKGISLHSIEILGVQLLALGAFAQHLVHKREDSLGIVDLARNILQIGIVRERLGLVMSLNVFVLSRVVGCQGHGREDSRRPLRRSFPCRGRC